MTEQDDLEPPETLDELLDTVSYGGDVGRWEHTPATGAAPDDPGGSVAQEGESL